MAKPRMERTHHSLITDGVAENEQTLATNKPFWGFFVTNVGVATWLMGVIIAGMGIGFTDALFVILIGGIIGSILPAMTATLGPLTRLPQIEMARLCLGRTGKKLPAFLNWVAMIGWDVINNVLSTAALVGFLTALGMSSPVWLALAILVGVQLVIGIYGHHLIQDTSKYTGILLGIFFVLVGLIAMHKTGYAMPVEKPVSGKDILTAIVLLVSYNISWTPTAADYTRYLPKNTPSRSVFAIVFSAIFLSLFILAIIGYVTASAVTDQTPDGVMKALQNLTGRFSPLVLFLIAFNSIPANAVNDNSAAYCLISSGIKVSRPTAAIFGAVIGYVVCLLATDSFVDFFENFLMLFAHWIAPWGAVLLVHWTMRGKKEQRTPAGITTGCIILVLTTILSITLFSANSLYTGFLANAVGGTDIGPYIGFVVAGSVYYIMLRLGKERKAKY